MASITDSDAMQVVTFRLRDDIYADAKKRAHELGITTISQYIRSLINRDLYGKDLFDKVAGDPVQTTDQAPPAGQSDPPEATVPAE